MMRLLRFLGAASACLLLASCGTGGLRVKDTTRTFTTVVVDAGHGGKDNGAFRRYGGAEKNATLDVGDPARHETPGVAIQGRNDPFG